MSSRTVALVTTALKVPATDATVRARGWTRLGHRHAKAPAAPSVPSATSATPNTTAMPPLTIRHPSLPGSCRVKFAAMSFVRDASRCHAPYRSHTSRRLIQVAPVYATSRPHGIRIASEAPSEARDIAAAITHTVGTTPRRRGGERARTGYKMSNSMSSPPPISGPRPNSKPVSELTPAQTIAHPLTPTLIGWSSSSPV